MNSSLGVFLRAGIVVKCCHTAEHSHAYSLDHNNTLFMMSHQGVDALIILYLFHTLRSHCVAL